METSMPPAVPISDDIFSAFLKCKYKAYLKLAGQAGETSPAAGPARSTRARRGQVVPPVAVHDRPEGQPVPQQDLLDPLRADIVNQLGVARRQVLDGRPAADD